MQLDQVSVRPIVKQEEEKYLELMSAGHYLGAIRRIGESIWYVASYGGQWIALISFSAAVLKCEARDRWIGWPYRHQTGRLKLVANNSRFLILSVDQTKNLGSRLLSLCLKRLSNDWMVKYGTRYCWWRLLLTPNATMVGFTEPVIGNWLVTAKAIGVLQAGIRPRYKVRN